MWLKLKIFLVDLCCYAVFLLVMSTTEGIAKTPNLITTIITFSIVFWAAAISFCPATEYMFFHESEKRSALIFLLVILYVAALLLVAKYRMEFFPVMFSVTYGSLIGIFAGSLNQVYYDRLSDSKQKKN